MQAVEGRDVPLLVTCEARTAQVPRQRHGRNPGSLRPGGSHGLSQSTDSRSAVYGGSRQEACGHLRHHSFVGKLAKRFKICTGGVVAGLNLADDLFCQILMKMTIAVAHSRPSARWWLRTSAILLRCSGIGSSARGSAGGCASEYRHLLP